MEKYHQYIGLQQINKLFGQNTDGTSEALYFNGHCQNRFKVILPGWRNKFIFVAHAAAVNILCWPLMPSRYKKLSHCAPLNKIISSIKVETFENVHANWLSITEGFGYTKYFPQSAWSADETTFGSRFQCPGCAGCPIRPLLRQSGVLCPVYLTWCGFSTLFPGKILHILWPRLSVITSQLLSYTRLRGWWSGVKMKER